MCEFKHLNQKKFRIECNIISMSVMGEKQSIREDCNQGSLQFGLDQIIRKKKL